MFAGGECSVTIGKCRLYDYHMCSYMLLQRTALHYLFLPHTSCPCCSIITESWQKAAPNQCVHHSLNTGIKAFSVWINKLKPWKANYIDGCLEQPYCKLGILSCKGISAIYWGMDYCESCWFEGWVLPCATCVNHVSWRLNVCWALIGVLIHTTISSALCRSIKRHLSPLYP